MSEVPLYVLQNPRKWQKQSGNLLMGHPVGTLNQAKALVGAFSVIVSLQSLRRFVPSSNSKTLEMVVSVDGRHLI